MKNMTALLAVALFLLFALAGCGDSNGGGCVELTGSNNFLLAFQQCPNDGIKSICNDFLCTFTEQSSGIPLPTPVVFNPADCSRIDFCFNLDCSLEEPPFGDAIFTIEEILTENEFIGVALLNDLGPFDFSCTPILP